MLYIFCWFRERKSRRLSFTLQVGKRSENRRRPFDLNEMKWMNFLVVVCRCRVRVVCKTYEESVERRILSQKASNKRYNYNNSCTTVYTHEQTTNTCCSTNSDAILATFVQDLATFFPFGTDKNGSGSRIFFSFFCFRNLSHSKCIKFLKILQ